ncbi:GntR family transcriptional regulator [Malaciobacter molluscorum LMG 25693]|uniref:GntR family transcriptional regulator n=1 Tax=Malaciobacter molluscorum LMG 25693 TaxID=870501 RepID=A0A2G1DFZ6_9BACT|nr:DoxX family protein [Malaciobacter molluscorum]AXX91704.1 putative membrane protein, DoxX family [Malaciobacter molluscorum LMG 25693]PHO17407.1 GntR family transcriptional regulator [Malaciobacter molluscorum LMG 25693]RXJ92834.1 GntR family transcriptional regulator [Malaciobacter molluscorum]
MNTTTSEDLGKLLLRLTLAILMLFHGYAKIKYGVSFVEGLLIKNNMPSFLAYGAYIGEIIAPILIIIGYKTRLCALIIIINMIVAIYLAHPQDLFLLSEYNAPVLETIYLYIFGYIAIMLLGAGKISVDGK